MLDGRLLSLKRVHHRSAHLDGLSLCVQAWTIPEG